MSSKTKRVRRQRRSVSSRKTRRRHKITSRTNRRNVINDIKDLYKTINPSSCISSEDDELFRQTNNQSTYGELTVEGMMKIFKTTPDAFPRSYNDNYTYFDLGSGLGRTVMYSALLFKFHNAIGYELSETRYNKAKQIKELYYKKQRGRRRNVNIDFINDSLLNADVSEANMIFISNLCFSEELNNQIGEKFDAELPIGCYVFSSRGIPMKKSKTLDPIDVKMSWIENSSLNRYKIVR
jgi:hypothetical protein